MRRLVVVTFVTALALGAIPAAAQNCDDVLVNQIDRSSFTERQTIAWLEMIDEGTYEKAKTSVGGQAYFGMFSGNYDSFKQRRTQYLSNKAGFDDRDTAREAFKSYLTDTQVNAWLQCSTSQVGLVITYKEVDKNGATIVVRWSDGAVAGPLRNPRASFGGVAEKPDFSAISEFSGTQSFILTREAEGQAMRGTITGQAGVNNKSFSADVYVPSFSQPIGSVITMPPISQRLMVPLAGRVLRSFAFWAGGRENNNWNCLATPTGFDFIELQTEDRGLGRRRGACVANDGNAYCDSHAEHCVDRVIVRGCFISRDWHEKYRAYLEHTGIPYSKQSLCDETMGS